MKSVAVVLIIGSFALWGCGDDDGAGDGEVQAELAGLLAQGAELGVDAGCVRDKIGELSDDQAQFLIDNIESDSTDGFDLELQRWIADLSECVNEPATGSGNREPLHDEVDGVRAEVADCFVVEMSDGGRRYQATIEVHNGSDAAQKVTVTVDADLGRGGVSDSIEIPAGANDAWAVTSDEESIQEVGDVECTDYINAIRVGLG
jgi:hypothetical protein